MAHDCNPSMWEVDAIRLQVQSQSELYNEIKAILGYIVRPYLK